MNVEMFYLEPITVSLTPSRNQTEGRHWKVKHYYKKLYEAELAGYRHKMPKNIGECYKAHVRFVRHSIRELDYDNLVGGMKQLVDSMKGEGLIINDNPKWFEAKYEQVKHKKSELKKRMITMIFIGLEKLC